MATETKTTSPKYPQVKVKLTGRDGNAFGVIGACLKAARKAGLTDDERIAFQDEAMAGDYGHLLRTCMSYFDVS